MNTHQKHPELHYLVANASTGLAEGLRCAHGDTAVSVEFSGVPCKPGALPAAIETLVPRCGLAQIIGSVLATIRHQEGPAAEQRFREQIRLAETIARNELKQR
ncbi:hypothetical protein ACFWM5_00510 [Streptomyces bobili]|uniref:hypothetical protein n=1 Tax=Streptomyces bobili TaxID=67280 RepID=UPI0036474443